MWKQAEFVAGHQFYPAGVCSCGRRWLDIRNCTAADEDATGIAHYGKLSAQECQQIERKRAEEDAALEAAMASVTGRHAAAAALPEDWVLFCRRIAA
jgi:hypothetical protein